MYLLQIRGKQGEKFVGKKTTISTKLKRLIN